MLVDLDHALERRGRSRSLARVGDSIENQGHRVVNVPATAEQESEPEVVILHEDRLTKAANGPEGVGPDHGGHEDAVRPQHVFDTKGGDRPRVPCRVERDDLA